jgi:hypothetical protein
VILVNERTGYDGGLSLLEFKKSLLEQSYALLEVHIVFEIIHGGMIAAFTAFTPG